MQVSYAISWAALGLLVQACGGSTTTPRSAQPVRHAATLEARPAPRADAPGPAPAAGHADVASAREVSPPPPSPQPGAGPIVYPTREAAASAAVENLGPGEPTEVDVDGDGVQDVVLSRYPFCWLLRRRAEGWIQEELRMDSYGDSPDDEPCTALPFAGRALLVLHRQGHDSGREDGHAFSYWSQMYSVHEALPGRALRTVFEDFTDNDHRGSAHLSFSVLGGDMLVETAMVSPGGPEHTILRRGASGAFEPLGCRSATQPAAPPVVLTDCHGRPRASFHLRPLETATRGASIEYPAGTDLEVLWATPVHRGAATLYCTRARGGELGYAYLLPREELAGCAGLPR